MKKLEQAGYRLNPNKCEFFKKEIEWVGHKIDQQGIRPLQDKLEVITKITNFMSVLSYNKSARLLQSLVIFILLSYNKGARLLQSLVIFVLLSCNKGARLLQTLVIFVLLSYNKGARLLQTLGIFVLL